VCQQDLNSHLLIEPCSIFGEIGPGERVALSKLAVEHYEKTCRPFRIAVDISIWNFQIQSGKGGSNPALRTLYYRLLRLLSLNIQPLFVFDGPHKPPFKRNAKTSQNTAYLPNFMTKELLKQFGFPFHTAPGEAEAECVLLQREGIVDAVFSEDVDTLMFGCGLSLRNWTSEGTRGNKTPTHVNLYEAKATKEGKSGLDRSGMILVALMSGGDYIPAGIPGCGIKIACQAAKAGFGADLCDLSRKDKTGLQQWREKLAHELKTNESHFFRSKHKALTIPENFPDSAVLGYYTHPVVSSSETISQLLTSVNWDSPIDIPGLRHFVAEAFEWRNMSGAKKFVRGLAPALLVYRLRVRGESNLLDSDDSKAKEQEESKLVTSICGRRSHFNTDGTPEIRVEYIPADIVGLNLDNDESDEGLVNIGSESDDPLSCEDSRGRSRSHVKRSTYNPTKSEKIWILETYAKLGVPSMVETWEESMRLPKKRVVIKARQRAPLGGTKKGALDAFFKVAKPSISRVKVADTIDLAPEFLAPSTAVIPGRPEENSSTVKRSSKIEYEGKISTQTRKSGKPSLRRQSSPNTLAPTIPPHAGTNPWTLAKRPSDTFDCQISPRARYSTLGIQGFPESDEEVALGTLSCPLSTTPHTPKHTSKKHSRLSTASLSETENNGIQEEPSSLKPASPRDFSSNGVNLCKPSPRKKRTPTKAACGEAQIQAVRTPENSKKQRPKTTSDDVSSNEPLTCYKVNRTLNFSPAPTPPPASPASSSSSLPSLSTLLSPLSSKATKPSLGIPSLPESRCSQSWLQDQQKGRLTALRESLDGTWKDLEVWEVDARPGVVVYKDVKILDLTGD